jgi:hypothetical protein
MAEEGFGSKDSQMLVVKVEGLWYVAEVKKVCKGVKGL